MLGPLLVVEGGLADPMLAAQIGRLLTIAPRRRLCVHSGYRWHHGLICADGTVLNVRCDSQGHAQAHPGETWLGPAHTTLSNFGVIFQIRGPACPLSAAYFLPLERAASSSSSRNCSMGVFSG
jgi:hypothetical protein